MSRLLENILLTTYKIVHSTGILSTDFGWYTYAAVYRKYKEMFDLDLQAIQRFISPGSVVVDVGANVGSSTLKLAEWVGDNGKVLAIEPEPRNILALNRAIRKSKYADRVTIIKVAAADQNGRVGLLLNELNPGDHRIGKGDLQVEAATLDKILAGQDARNISVIKIDVQGAEPLVLKGASNTLMRKRPVIFIELFEEGLRMFGYTLYLILFNCCWNWTTNLT